MFYTSVFSFVIPVIAFLLFQKRNKEALAGLIFLYVVYSFFNDIAILNFVIQKSTKFLLLSIFTLVEYSIFAYYLYNKLRSPLIKKLLLGLSVLFFAFVIYFHFATINTKFDSLPVSIEALIIILFSILFLFEQINQPEVVFIYTEKSFWIVCGFLIYMAGTFFLFLQSSNLTQDDLYKFWVISWTCNILKNIFFAVAFIIKPEKENDALSNYRSISY